jgi:hypothetical protein
MNWSDELKVIWLLPMRTGARSVGQILLKLGFQSSIKDTFPDHALLFPESMSEYQVICNVRNPYSRIVSLYFLTQNNLRKEFTFQYFVENIFEILKGKNTFGIYVNLIRNKKIPDKIIRFENFIEDIMSLDLIQLKYHDLEKTINDHIIFNNFLTEHSEVKKKFTSWKEMYNEELAEIVYNSMEEDFINFNYEKNSWK